MVLKRIIGVLGGLLRRTKPNGSDSTQTGVVGTILTNSGNVRVQQANQDLADAIKTLSHSNTMVVQRPDVEAKLQSLGSLDLGTMPIEEIEELARLHFEGSPLIEKDQNRAFELWKAAAERGSLEAKYSCALCMKDGIGTEKNCVTAAEELRVLSEEKNYNLAHYSLALMHYVGDGIPQNYEEAFKLFKKAARGGVTPALHNIGNCYADGKGAKQSDKNALLYYQAADEAGDHFASFTLGTWYYSGRGGLEVSKEKSFQLQLKAAQRGHPGAMFNIGTALLTGDGVEKDKENALKWLQHAANAGIVPARLNLAKVYMEGDRSSRRLDDAAELLKPIEDKNEVAKELLKEIQLLRSS